MIKLVLKKQCAIMKLIIYLDIIDHFSAKAIFNSDETNALRKES